MQEDFDDDGEDRPGPMRWVLAAGAVIAVGTMVAVLAGGHHAPKPEPPQQIIHVALPPPPKPPPPPPPPKEPDKTTDVKTKTVMAEKPIPNQPAKPAPKAPPSPALTAAAGAGTNAYGLQAGQGGGGSVIGGDGDGAAGGGGGNDRWGAYAGQIQASLEAALQRDERTRSGHYLLGLRIWLSGSGQVTRAKIVASTGDASLDQAIVAVVGGVSVGTAPPADMPQPVNLQVRARTG